MSQPIPVLLIASAFPPENVIGSLRPGRFFRYLPEFGYEPYVLTASPQTVSNPRIEVAPYNHGLIGKLWRLTLDPGDDRPNWAAAAKRAGTALLRQRPCRLILATSPPYSVHSAAAALARQFDIPWVADVRDPLIGNAVRRERAPYSWIDRFMERTILSADRVVLNTEAAQADWKRRYPTLADRLDVLYNGFDPGSLPAPAEPSRGREKRILLHAGSLYNHQYAAILLRALRKMTDRSRLDPRHFELQFIGELPDSVPALEDFRILAERKIIESAVHHLSRAEAQQRMREADYLLLVDYFKEGGSLQLPAKMFDYLPVGRPILAITTPDSPMHRVLTLSGMPHVAIFPSDGEDAVRDKLEQLMTIPAGPFTLSDAYLQRFDGRNQTAELARIFDRALERH